MITWRDEGIVLHIKPLQETGLLVSILTHQHGRQMGVIKGRTSKRWVQIGSKGSVQWQARLEEQLGYWTIETLQQPLAPYYDAPLKLEAFNSFASLAHLLLIERHPYPYLFEVMATFLQALSHEDWLYHYIQAEMQLLSVLGYGLDLSRCAVTGQTDHLSHISPRTGRAVSYEAAQPYADRLLRLPLILHHPLEDPSALTPTNILDGLRVTEFFIERFLLQPHHVPYPQARLRLMERLRRKQQGK